MDDILLTRQLHGKRKAHIAPETCSRSLMSPHWLEHCHMSTPTPEKAGKASVQLFHFFLRFILLMCMCMCAQVSEEAREGFGPLSWS